MSSTLDIAVGSAVGNAVRSVAGNAMMVDVGNAVLSVVGNAVRSIVDYSADIAERRRRATRSVSAGPLYNPSDPRRGRCAHPG